MLLQLPQTCPAIPPSLPGKASARLIFHFTLHKYV